MLKIRVKYVFSSGDFRFSSFFKLKYNLVFNFKRLLILIFFNQIFLFLFTVSNTFIININVSNMTNNPNAIKNEYAYYIFNNETTSNNLSYLKSIYNLLQYVKE